MCNTKTLLKTYMKEISEKDQKIGELSAKLSQYEGVTGAIFARGILEDFRKRYLRRYTHTVRAEDIENAYVSFLTDPNNINGVKMAEKLRDNGVTPQAFAQNCRSAYVKLSSVAHAASNAYRTLYSAERFREVIFEIPQLDESEKLSVKVLSTFVKN